MKKKLFVSLIFSIFFISGCVQVTPLDQVPLESEENTEVSNLDFTKPEMQIDVTKTYLANFSTDYGDFQIKLYAKDAPITVNNFVTLANKGYYDGLTFHRIVDGFMIQGGDPNGDGTGGPGYQFENEIHENYKNNRGTIAMANAGEDTNGSQFFVNLVDNNFLDLKYTVFGEVVSGMEVVDEISKVEVEMSQGGEMSVPVEPVYMNSIKIEQID